MSPWSLRRSSSTKRSAQFQLHGEVCPASGLRLNCTVAGPAHQASELCGSDSCSRTQGPGVPEHSCSSLHTLSKGPWTPQRVLVCADIPHFLHGHWVRVAVAGALYHMSLWLPPCIPVIGSQSLERTYRGWAENSETSHMDLLSQPHGPISSVPSGLP